MLLTGLLALGFLSVFQEDGGEEAAFAFVVDVDLVVFNVTVTDDDGALARGLTEADFTIVEDGAAQEIRLFRADTAPATVGLIVDSSGSVQGTQDEVARAAYALAEDIGPDDEVFLVAFNEHTFVYQPGSSPEQLREAVLRRPPMGMTAFYDALVVGLDAVQRGTRDRKALLVLSDGGDNASARSFDDVIAAARRSSATIFTVDIYDPYNRDRKPRVLRDIAELTGGQAYFVDSADELEGIWRDVAGSIRAQYSLGYYPTNTARDGTFREVQIRAVRDGKTLNVRTRSGYFAPGDGR